VYIIKVGFGDIRVKNTTGEYDISLNTGNIEVIDGVFIGKNNTFKTEAGRISVKFGKNQGETEVEGSVGGHVDRKLFFEGVKNPDGQTARLSLSTQAGKIRVISK